MYSGHFCCDILGFNTGTWLRCDDDNITPLRVLPDNFYSYASNKTTEKIINNDKRIG